MASNCRQPTGRRPSTAAEFVCVSGGAANLTGNELPTGNQVETKLAQLTPRLVCGHTRNFWPLVARIGLQNVHVIESIKLVGRTGKDDDYDDWQLICRPLRSNLWLACNHYGASSQLSALPVTTLVARRRRRRPYGTPVGRRAQRLLQFREHPKRKRNEWRPTKCESRVQKRRERKQIDAPKQREMAKFDGSN